MSHRLVTLRTASDFGRLSFVDAQHNDLGAERLQFVSRETLDIDVYCYAERAAIDLSGASGTFEIAAKDPDDLDGDKLFTATVAAPGTAAGLIRFVDVDLNTVELDDFLGADGAKGIALELRLYDGVDETRIYATNGDNPEGNAVLVHDVVQGDESAPVYANPLKHNTSATAAPTATDDSGEGYAIGSVWTVVSGALVGNIYLCTDPTEDAASWVNITSSATAAITALAALTPAADRVPYFDSSTTAALAVLTAFARSLLDDADAATARATLGLGAAALLADPVPLANGGTGATTAPTALAALGGTSLAALQALTKSAAVTGSVTVDLANLEEQWTLTGNVTVTATANAVADRVRRVSLELVASGGTRTVDLPAAWVWPNGNKPSADQISLAAGETGVLIVEDVDNSTRVRAYYAQDET